MSCYRKIVKGRIVNVWIKQVGKIEWNSILDDEDLTSQLIDKYCSKEHITPKRIFKEIV